MSFWFVTSGTRHVYIEGFRFDYNHPEFHGRGIMSMKYSVQFNITRNGGAFICVLTYNAVSFTLEDGSANLKKFPFI